MRRAPGRVHFRTESGWRRLFPLLFGILLLLLLPVVAQAQGGGPDSVNLSWTAPGDDGAIGTAALYDLRISTATITAGNWNNAVSVPGLPAPLVSGTRQSTLVSSLSRDTIYYFAIRTRDDEGNWSNISNVVRWDWVLDAAPPAAPAGVSAARQDPNVRVQWSANSEPDLNGYSVYRAAAAAGPFTRVTGSLVTNTQWVDAAVPGGATQLWYRVTATDLSGNESALSATASVNFTSGSGAGADWTMSPAYPNPSRAGQNVCIPIVLPLAGAGNAVLDVVDAAGRRIRRIELSGATTCATGVVWDGRNEDGREVAPGVYRAWLITGDRREHVKLVRQP